MKEIIDIETVLMHHEKNAVLVINFIISILRIADMSRFVIFCVVSLKMCAW